MDTAYEPGSDQTPVQSAQALAALHGAFADHEFVHKLAMRFRTWGALAAASPGDRAMLADQRAVTMTIPPRCPPMPDLPFGVVCVPRYSPTYPQRLLELSSPPTVLYVRGAIPLTPSVAIGGARYPSPQGTEIARSAALAAAAQRVPVVAAVTDGVSMTAIRTAVAAGAVVVAVLAHGVSQMSVHQQLLREVVNLGGAVVSAYHPRMAGDLDAARATAELVVALAQAVTLAEVGPGLEAGAQIARAAVEQGRFLIVPTPQQHHVPESALGLSILTDARAFSPAWFGTSARVDARINNAQTPADAVVTSQEQITAAIALACGHSD